MTSAHSHKHDHASDYGKSKPVAVEQAFIDFPSVPRLVGYARVSTEEQNLGMQVAQLTAAGVDPKEDLFSDKMSATNARRPEFNLMKKHLQRGDTLLVYSVSRIFRDARLLLNFLDEMKAEGVEVKSLTESLDLKTSHGRMIATILAAVDQNERERVRDRTKDGMAELKRQGQYIGRPPKVDAAQIQMMRDMRARKISVDIIAAKFKIAKPTVYFYTSTKRAA